jgi:hypothetical protein
VREPACSGSSRLRTTPPRARAAQARRTSGRRERTRQRRSAGKLIRGTSTTTRAAAGSTCGPTPSDKRMSVQETGPEPVCHASGDTGMSTCVVFETPAASK